MELWIVGATLINLIALAITVRVQYRRVRRVEVAQEESARDRAAIHAELARQGAAQQEMDRKVGAELHRLANIGVNMAQRFDMQTRIIEQMRQQLDKQGTRQDNQQDLQNALNIMLAAMGTHTAVGSIYTGGGAAATGGNAYDQRGQRLAPPQPNEQGTPP